MNFGAYVLFLVYLANSALFNQLPNTAGNNVSASNQTEETKAILEQLILRQSREQQQTSPLNNLQPSNVVNVLNRLQQHIGESISNSD